MHDTGIQRMLADVSTCGGSFLSTSASIFLCVIEFLHSSGQTTLLAQVQYSYGEMRIIGISFCGTAHSLDQNGIETVLSSIEIRQ